MINEGVQLDEDDDDTVSIMMALMRIPCHDQSTEATLNILVISELLRGSRGEAEAGERLVSFVDILYLPKGIYQKR